MIDGIIAEMTELFQKGVFTKRTTYFFIIEEVKVTVEMEPDRYSVILAEPEQQADCFCKTSAEMFQKIWYDGFRPGIMDFFSGAIKTNDPLMLLQFIHAFGK